MSCWPLGPFIIYGRLVTSLVLWITSIIRKFILCQSNKIIIHLSSGRKALRSQISNDKVKDAADDTTDEHQKIIIRNMAMHSCKDDDS